MPRSRINFAEPKSRKKSVSVDDRVVRWITLAVLVGLVGVIQYIHPAFLYR
jgi:hypothetical protein